MNQSNDEIDHRRLGQDLDLFYFDELAPASPFFMPKGAFVYNQLINFIRQLYERVGYQEVITPQVLNIDLWKTSGHYDNYKQNMFFVSGGSGVEEPAYAEYGIKPMNCPCHMLMFKHRKWSYRDLPLRYADFGRLHRFELSGSISGLTRVRSFCQDDSHIFLGVSQIENEIRNLLKLFLSCYQFFGFSKIKLYLSTRPQKRMGSDHIWDQAENALKAALDSCDFELKEGDGAFYGPKIDLEISDAHGRDWQLGTIQLDFLLPERFDLGFINSTGERERPVVIHRAILGSIERFMAVYLEHVKGNLPLWLAPEQLVILPISEKHTTYASEIGRFLGHRNVRLRIDDRNESLSYRVRDWQLRKIPFSITIGDKEASNKTVSLRKRDQKNSVSLSLVELAQHFESLTNEYLNSIRAITSG